MKRKLCMWLLLICCAIFMTACSGKEETIKPLEEQQDTPIEENNAKENESADAEEKGMQDAEEGGKEQAQESETPARIREETEKTEDEDGEAKEEEAAKLANVPEKLSDNLYDFQISIDGTVYQFPMWYSDFEALGWQYDGDNTDTLSNNQYVSAQRWNKDAASVYTKLANMSMNTVSFADSMVAGINMDRYQMKDSDWEILLPGGIQWGVSNADDIKAAYGDPTSDYDGDNYYKMSYQYDFYREIELYVYKDTGVLEQIEIENLVELEGADNSVSDEVPDIVKSYQAPTELGNDLYSFHVELEGNLYKLPCPVSELIANGFTIVEEKSDMEVASGSFGWVCLQYNNQSFRAIARNYAEYAVTIENCMLTAMESSDFSSDLALVIPGNIKRGDLQADVEKAIESFHSETETSSSGFTYYTVYDPDGSKLCNYTICVKEGKVFQIEVANDKKPE